MKEKKKSNPTTFDNPMLFFQAFSSVFRAGEVVIIEDNEERIFNWDIYSATIYCFLYNRINNQHGKTQLSMEYIAGDCNCSVSTCKDRIHNMEKANILRVKRGKELGLNKVNTYESIANIITDNRFKLKPNKHRVNYLAMVANRNKRKALLQGIVIKKSWTQQEVMNYIRNTNYELRTGEFLTGDKLASLLYIKPNKHGRLTHNQNDNFQIKDELKAYELEQIIDDAERE